MKKINLILRKTIAFIAVFLIVWIGLSSLHVYFKTEMWTLLKIIVLFITLATLTVPAWAFWEPKIERLLKICGKETVEYKEKQYKILHQAKLKNQKTREWEDVVVYQNEEEMVFVREREEFFERFK
jgi:hypothetical protein